MTLPNDECECLYSDRIYTKIPYAMIHWYGSNAEDDAY